MPSAEPPLKNNIISMTLTKTIHQLSVIHKQHHLKSVLLTHVKMTKCVPQSLGPHDLFILPSEVTKPFITKDSSYSRLPQYTTKYQGDFSGNLCCCRSTLSRQLFKAYTLIGTDICIKNWPPQNSSKASICSTAKENFGGSRKRGELMPLDLCSLFCSFFYREVCQLPCARDLF